MQILGQFFTTGLNSLYFYVISFLPTQQRAFRRGQIRTSADRRDG